VTGDLSNTDDLVAALSGVETVIHLAARVPSTRRKTTDAPGFQINSVITERIFRAAAQSRVRRFVYVSSVKAVGEETTGVPWTENTPPHPTDAYGESKLLGEETVKRLGSETRLEVVVIRPPYVYGPGVRGHFPALVRLAKLSRWIPIPLGGIDNRRSVLFVHNLSSALSLLSHHAGASGRTFFIADGAPKSTPDIVRAVGIALGIKPRLYAVKPSYLESVGRVVGLGNEIRKVCASLEVDDTLLRSVTGWRPPFTFEDGISQTVARRFPLVSPNTLE
jgi:nucleoside-diphosphate-sugar epimerase